MVSSPYPVGYEPHTLKDAAEMPLIEALKIAQESISREMAEVRPYCRQRPARGPRLTAEQQRANAHFDKLHRAKLVIIQARAELKAGAVLGSMQGGIENGA